MPPAFWPGAYRYCTTLLDSTLLVFVPQQRRKDDRRPHENLGQTTGGEPPEGYAGPRRGDRGDHQPSLSDFEVFVQVFPLLLL